MRFFFFLALKIISIEAFNIHKHLLVANVKKGKKEAISNFETF